MLTGEAEGAMTLAALRASGRNAMDADAALMARLRARVSPADPAILYLTSGATGEPKMALVTHQAIVANIDMGPAVLPMGPEDSTVAFLPSAHIAQRVVIGVSADALRHAGDVLREPAEVAAGYPQGAAHDSARPAAHVGTDLFHHLHGVEQASSCRRGKRF